MAVRGICAKGLSHASQLVHLAWPTSCFRKCDARARGFTFYPSITHLIVYFSHLPELMFCNSKCFECKICCGQLQCVQMPTGEVLHEVCPCIERASVCGYVSMFTLGSTVLSHSFFVCVRVWQHTMVCSGAKTTALM